MDDNDGVNRLLDNVKDMGVAVSSIKDGYILMLTKSKLKEILAVLDKDNHDQCVIFVRTNFKGD